MSRLMRFPSAIKRDPAVEIWMHKHSDDLGVIAQQWFEVMRKCGDNVQELLHDVHPTACIGDAAFGNVNVFTNHVNVGFFLGPELEDPQVLLEGTGKFMRHVKLRRGQEINVAALKFLVENAYTGVSLRLKLGLTNQSR